MATRRGQPRKGVPARATAAGAKGPVELELTSKQALCMGSPASIVIFGGGNGGGKASHVDAMVCTPFGFKRMGDIQVGDQVSNPDGSIARVIATYPQGIQPLYKIRFIDGAETRVTGDHLWLARKTARTLKADRRYEPFEEENRVNGKLYTTRMLIEELEKDVTNTSNTLVPLAKPVKFTKSYRVPQLTVDPYVLGLLLGDGCLRNRAITFSSEDDPILEQLSNLTDMPLIGRKKGSTCDFRFVEVARLREELTRLGVYGCLAYDKFIPECYKLAPVEARLALVQGLMDTDGTADDRGHPSFTSVSLRLAQDMQWLIRSLGGKATLTDKQPFYRDKEGNRKDGQTAYTLYIQTKMNPSLFRLQRKKDLCSLSWNDGSDLSRRIVAIEPDGEGEAKCIRVDHPNGLYITDDFIVTHNSQLLLYAPLPNMGFAGYDAVLFHENLTKIKMPGGIMDRSKKIYAPLAPNGHDALNLQDRRWRFPTPEVAGASGESSITMSFVGEVGQWDGLEAGFIGIDQVEQISEAQFFSLVGRCRSTCGAPEKIIATANPGGPDHWLTRFLIGGGWIGGDGYPIEDRDAKVRFYARVGDDYLWGDSPEELIPYLEKDRAGKPIPPKSVTFVAALVDDNPYGSSSYKATLASLPEIERMRRLKGNWLVLEDAGKYFKAEYFPKRDLPPSAKARYVRSWDNAWSDVGNADWTVGVLLAIEPDSSILVCDMIRLRGTAAHVERAIELIAQLDGKKIPIRIPLDAGQGGKEQTTWARKLGAKGYTIRATRDVGDKLERSKPYQACAERRQVSLLTSHPSQSIACLLQEPWELPDGSILKPADVSTVAGWHAPFVSEHVSFGKRSASGRLQGKKDIVDACTAGFTYLTQDQGPTFEQIKGSVEAARALSKSLSKQDRTSLRFEGGNLIGLGNLPNW